MAAAPEAGAFARESAGVCAAAREFEPVGLEAVLLVEGPLARAALVGPFATAEPAGPFAAANPAGLFAAPEPAGPLAARGAPVGDPGVPTVTGAAPGAAAITDPGPATGGCAIGVLALGFAAANVVASC